MRRRGEPGGPHSSLSWVGRVSSENPGGVSMGLDQNQFRKVMGLRPAGVTVVTTSDGAGRTWGLTATAVCGVSLEPPLLLVCIDREADCHSAFLETQGFAVNLLRRDQEELSRRFASKDPRKFEGVAFRAGITGAPVMTNVLATMECRMVARYPGGDHTIFVGQVISCAAPPGEEVGSPLLYFRGDYTGVANRLPADVSSPRSG